MDTSPTCHRCNSVLTPFTLNTIISFPCNHQICSKCLVLYLLKHDISILTLESLNKNNITLKCKCDKGKVDLSYEELMQVKDKLLTLENSLLDVAEEILS